MTNTQENSLRSRKRTYKRFQALAVLFTCACRIPRTTVSDARVVPWLVTVLGGVALKLPTVPARDVHLPGEFDSRFARRCLISK